jgi:Zn-dependent protease with chaperone function
MSMLSDPSEPPISARFSDGKSAAAVNVEVRLGAAGVEIIVPGSEAVIWPYDSLTAAEPITAHAIDVLLSSTAQPGATLFVPEAAFARQLPAHAPQLTARSIRWRHARPWVWASGGVALLAVLIWVLDLSPSHAVAKLLPDSARETLGKEVVRSMTAGKNVCRDGNGLAALDRLTARLAGPGDQRKYKIIVVDWDLMNAFAVPGEQIVLTRGLIAKADSPDEVAGVLAHEMGHGIEMHPETALVRAIGLSAAAELMLGGSGGTLANIGIVLAQLSYTRDAERDADQHALQILKRAGVSAEGLAKFFDRVTKLEDDKSGLNEIGILRSHPLTEERRSIVESQPPYPATPSLSARDWAALKAICSEPKPTDI